MKNVCLSEYIVFIRVVLRFYRRTNISPWTFPHRAFPASVLDYIAHIPSVTVFFVRATLCWRGPSYCLASVSVSLSVRQSQVEVLSKRMYGSKWLLANWHWALFKLSYTVL